MTWLTKRRAIRQRRKITAPGGIQIYEPVLIGGIKQWIEVRGQSRDNPIILYLHGGPGASMKASAHLFQDAWERHFTVVQWDQRGVGRTFHGHGAAIRDTMTFERMVEDAQELMRHLLERFGKDRLVLLGHSWGSALGIALAHRHPEMISSYVGVGQVVQMRRNEEVSYAHVLRLAHESKNQKAIEALTAIGPSPLTGTWSEVKHKLAVQRIWLHRFGGCMTGAKSMWPLFKPMFYDPDQSMLDLFAHARGLVFSTDTLGKEFLQFDAARFGLDFKVPMLFLAGRHDINTPSELAYAYFERITAPRKEFIWFEHSAHDAPSAEPERFLTELVRLTCGSTPDQQAGE